MKREEYFVRVIDSDGRELGTETRYTLRAARLASEAIVRTHARMIGTLYLGAPAERTETTYTRDWFDDDG